MLRAVGLVPSPPLLVPELTGDGADEAEPVRTAALAAAGLLGSVSNRWLVLAAAETERTTAPSAAGTFAGYGVDVPVGLSADADRFDPEVPLEALIAGWLRGRSAPGATVEVRFVDRSTSATDCHRIGRDVRRDLDADPAARALLVIADGATTLTAKAPGAYDERAEGVQQRIDDALAAANPSALADLDQNLCAELGVASLATWHTLAGVIDGDRPVSRTLYRGAPFGVGYFVGTWELTGA